MSLFSLDQEIWQPIDEYTREIASTIRTTTLQEKAEEINRAIQMSDDESQIFAFISDGLPCELEDAPYNDGWLEEIGDMDMEELIVKRIKQILESMN